MDTKTRFNRVAGILASACAPFILLMGAYQLSKSGPSPKAFAENGFRGYCRMNMNREVEIYEYDDLRDGQPHLTKTFTFTPSPTKGHGLEADRINAVNLYRDLPPKFVATYTPGEGCTVRVQRQQQLQPAFLRYTNQEDFEAAFRGANPKSFPPPPDPQPLLNVLQDREPLSSSASVHQIGPPR